MTNPDRVHRGGERYYRVEGEEYPSVTTILNHYKPKRQKINNWEKRLRGEGRDPRKVRDKAALRGTLAHFRILDRYAIRDLPLPEVDMSEVDEELMTDVEVCVALWDDLGFEVGDSPHVETPVWSHEIGYAGTLDLLTNGSIVDLKTSKAAFSSHKMQAAAYHYAATEMPDLPDPDKAAIVVLHPGDDDIIGDIHWLTADEIDRWFETFLDVLSSFKKQEKIV